MASEPLRLAGIAPPEQRTAERVRLGRLPPLHLPALLLLTLLLVVLAYQQIDSFVLTMGPHDQRMVLDAHALEPGNQPATDSIRWTSDHTRLHLPQIAAHQPLIMNLAVVNSYPPAFADPNIDIALGERHLTSFYVERNNALIRQHQLLLPPQDRAGWHIPLHIRSTTIQPSVEDFRDLGVVLVRASLTTTSASGLVLPPLWQVTALLVCAAAAYFTMRGIGAGRWLAWGLALAVVVALLVGLLVSYVAFAPSTMRLAGLLSLGALYGLALHLLSVGRVGMPPPPAESALSSAPPGRGWVGLERPVKTEPERPPPTPSVQPVSPWAMPVSLVTVVLLFGLAHWLMPLYQVLMTADGARNVSPYLPTLLVTLAVFGGSLLAVGMVWDMQRGQHWYRVVLAVLAVGAVVHLALMIQFALGRSGPDFWILFKGAREWFRGGSMYDLVAVEENHFGHVFKVPPFYGMLFVPFAEQDGLMILFWHRMLNCALLLLTALLLFQTFGVRLVSVLGVGVLLLFNMRPIADTIAYGQIDILLLLLLLIAVAALRRGWLLLAGAAVALGTLFKLYPVLLLGFFVLKRQWRAIGGFALAMLLCNGLAVAIIGWEMHRVYLFEVVPRIGGGTSWVENQTLNGFVSRLLAPDIAAATFDHPLVSLVTYGGFLLALAGTALLTLRPVERSDSRLVLQIGLYVILMVLFVPAAWMHYQTIMVLPLAGLLLYAWEHGLARWQAGLAGVGYALVAYGNQWSFYDSALSDALTVLGTSYKFYGLVLLTVVVVACLWRGYQPRPAVQGFIAAFQRISQK